jgi:hypothetical protein
MRILPRVCIGDAELSRLIYFFAWRLAVLRRRGVVVLTHATRSISKRNIFWILEERASDNGSGRSHAKTVAKGRTQKRPKRERKKSRKTGSQTQSWRDWREGKTREREGTNRSHQA